MDMGISARTNCCDICGVPVDKDDFYEMTLSHRFTVEREVQLWNGKFHTVKDPKSKRLVPGVKLCAKCADNEKARMQLMIDKDGE